MKKVIVVLEEIGLKVWTTDEPGFFIREYTDQAVAQDGQGIVEIHGKAIANAGICIECFAMLERNGSPTHIQDRFSDTELIVHKLTTLPLEVHCSNVAAGDLARRLDAPDGQVLPIPVVEFLLKNEALNNPRYNYEHISVAGNVSEGEVKVLQARSIEINALLKDFFMRRGIVLVDCALEFGRDRNNEVNIGGDITPDTCRLWDRETHEKLDRDIFRRDLRGDELAYRTVMRRLSGESDQ